MSAFALSLLLAAGALHAGWNLIIKQAGDRTIVTWWALVAGSVIFLPVLLAGRIAAGTWPLLVTSALVECAYYLALAYAYGQADFSQVYPLARGAAPAFLTGWTALALHEYPSRAGGLGLALIVLGLVPVGSVSSGWWRPALRSRGVVAALGVALCISVYSLIDGVAVRRTSPAPYTVGVLLLTAVLQTPLMLGRYGGRAALAVWREQYLRIIAAGVMTMVAYLLVLHAYSIAPLAYAGAVREVGVVIAALVGWLWLGERFGARRVAGAIAVFVGILVLAVLG